MTATRHILAKILISAFTTLPASTRELNEQKQFQYLEYGAMLERIDHLALKYPDLIKIFVAQDRYQLPYPPQLSCPLDHRNPHSRHELCRQTVLFVTNHTSLQLQNDSRPEIFISGALHGDERIGPLASVELAALLAEKATSFAEQMSENATSSDNPSSTVRWLHHLVNTRSVFIIPMTNAYGYANYKREEFGIDTNRDYNILTAPHCMRSMTSRVVNELWIDHVFEAGVTFHAGTRAIAYEWGSLDHYKNQISPDNAGFSTLADSLTIYAGQFPDGGSYPIGTMDSVVYGVNGGMEDWSYAASWEDAAAKIAHVKKMPFATCQPTEYGGYPASKTIYNNVTHRTMLWLVETSNRKIPDKASLGYRNELYDRELDYSFRKDASQSEGHVTRNVRLALMVIEMVRPYIRWLDIATNEEKASRDAFVSANIFVEHNVISQSTLSQIKCPLANNKAFVAHCNQIYCTVPVSRKDDINTTVIVAWEVLGALTVDETYLELSSSSNFGKKDILKTTKAQSGSTRRSMKAKAEGSSVQSEKLPFFYDCITLPTEFFRSDNPIYIRATAKVDQNWKEQIFNGVGPSPLTPPQTHMVNVRTNPKWNMTSNGHHIQGFLYWNSSAIIVIGQVDPKSISPTIPSPIQTHAADANSSILLFGAFVVSCGALVIILTLLYLNHHIFRPRQKQYAKLKQNPIPSEQTTDNHSDSEHSDPIRDPSKEDD